MKASHNLATIPVTFDEANLVPNAGLIAPALLAQRLGLTDLVEQHVHLNPDRPGAANSAAKALTVLGGMLAGADSIDDLDVLRTGATPDLFDDVRAPSTIGTWLRAFGWGNVRQLDAVGRHVLKRAWAAGLGPVNLDAGLTIDIDSTIRQTYGLKKQGTRFGYTKVRGLHPLLATLSQTSEVLHTRLRGGNAGSARGAATFVRETIARVRNAGATGQLTLRADSAFYNKKVIAACRDHDVRFSITLPLNKSVRKAIEAIPAKAWTPIPYWLDGGADVAEVPYTCFSGKHAVEVRLIVRRVRPTPGSQLALDIVFDYHALVTDRQGSTVTVEAGHRDHAQVELVIRDWKDGPLAHMPSGVFTANAAWTALAALAHNLGRWTLHAAGGCWADATVGSLRRKLAGPVPGWHSARPRRRRSARTRPSGTARPASGRTHSA